MAGELFRVSDNDVVSVLPEALKLTKHLKRIKQKDMLRYIVLAYDYTSPLRQFIGDDRLLKARRSVFKTDDVIPEKDAMVMEAITEYCDLQFNLKMETIKTLRQKHSYMNAQLLSETKDTRISSLLDTIDLLEVKIKKLEQEYEEDENKSRRKGNRQETLIERWQMNQRNASAHRAEMDQFRGVEQIGQQ